MRVFVFAMVALTTITSATELDGTQKDVRSLLRRATSVDIQSAGSVSDGQQHAAGVGEIWQQGPNYVYNNLLYLDYSAAYNAQAKDLAAQQQWELQQKQKADRELKDMAMKQLQAQAWGRAFVIGGNALGAGAQGAVYKGHKGTSPSTDSIAVKVAKAGSLTHECEVMEAVAKSTNPFCRRHVIQLIGTCNAHAVSCNAYEHNMCTQYTDRDEQALGMELFDGSLQSFFERYPGHGMGCRETILSQIRGGLECLHSASFVHMDLKADNVFYSGVTTDGCPLRLVLGDLGLATKIGTAVPRATFNDAQFMGSQQTDMARWAQDSRPLVANAWLDDNGLALIDLCSIQGHCEPWTQTGRMRPYGVQTTYTATTRR